MTIIKALTIAGSDSGGGAGIQADIKTFSALGVYGCSVITAITSQNTQKVSKIFEIPPEIIKSQIQSILADIPPDAIKIGMVYSKSIIQCVIDCLSGIKVPIILDPIIAAGTGAKLLQEEALEKFTSALIPHATILTPNHTEAKLLSGIDIQTEKDAVNAAYKLKSYGAKNVIIKGGHSGSQETVVDLLLDQTNKITKFENPRIKIKETHGSGCNFSAAIAAYLARNFRIQDACRSANAYVHNAMTNALELGKGLVVTNPVSSMYLDACKFRTIRQLQYAVEKIETDKDFAKLIPETQTNFVFALPDASNLMDVAGIKGRIIKVGKFSKSASGVEFGASRHVGSSVLAYMSHDRSVRSAINIKYNRDIISICQSHYEVSFYDRFNEEPKNVKNAEGQSIRWGINSALSRNPRAEIIYHTGDIGKEPMTIIFGKNPSDVLLKVNKILKIY